MLLTITNTQPPATDLGYLLHKNPVRTQSFTLTFGRAHVFYPEAGPERCTAALLLDIDPVRLVRGSRRGGAEAGTIDHYINDRPYVASSFLSVAISQVYGSALAGRSNERPDLVETPLPLNAKLAVVPCRGGEGVLRRLFEPLGYAVVAHQHPLDERFPEWGEGPYFTVELSAHTRLRDLLTHLYVLVPVLDDDKHYWVGEDEVEKLLRHGNDWLAAHPERERIAERYLKHRKRLVRDTLARLIEGDTADPDAVDEDHGTEETIVEERIGLNAERLQAVLQALQESGAKRVIDLGCGEGKLLRMLVKDRRFEEIVGMDVSYRALEVAHDRLAIDRMPEKRREHVRLIHGALTYRDKRLLGYDAAAVIEVVEHLDSARLGAFERVLFEYTRPKTIVLTTPNVEYNVRFSGLTMGSFRHKDHRFEWTRSEFQNWATAVAERFGYSVVFGGIGLEDPEVGPPTQMGVFGLV